MAMRGGRGQEERALKGSGSCKAQDDGIDSALSEGVFAPGTAFLGCSFAINPYV